MKPWESNIIPSVHGSFYVLWAHGQWLKAQRLLPTPDPDHPPKKKMQAGRYLNKIEYRKLGSLQLDEWCSPGWKEKRQIKPTRPPGPYFSLVRHTPSKHPRTLPWKWQRIAINSSFISILTNLVSGNIYWFLFSNTETQLYSQEILTLSYTHEYIS